MAFAVHINMEHCTGSNICAVACPGDALELCMAESSSDEKICTVGNVNPVVPDSKDELFAGLWRLRQGISGRRYQAGWPLGIQPGSKSTIKKPREG